MLTAESYPEFSHFADGLIAFVLAVVERFTSRYMISIATCLMTQLGEQLRDLAAPGQSFGGVRAP